MKYNLQVLRSLKNFIDAGEITQKKVAIILGLPINGGLKARLLNTPERLENAELIHAAFCMIKPLDLREETQEMILLNPKLCKYAKHICVIDEQILANRKVIGINNTLEMIEHILKDDRSGKTTGCGCDLCVNRHRKYITRLKVDSFQSEKSRLNTLGTMLESSKDPFVSEFFNRRLGIFAKERVELQVTQYYVPCDTDKKGNELNRPRFRDSSSVFKTRKRETARFITNPQRKGIIVTRFNNAEEHVNKTLKVSRVIETKLTDVCAQLQRHIFSPF